MLEMGKTGFTTLEEITASMQSYEWKEEDFLLATYPKNGRFMQGHSSFPGE